MKINHKWNIRNERETGMNKWSTRKGKGTNDKRERQTAPWKRETIRIIDECEKQETRKDTKNKRWQA